MKPIDIQYIQETIEKLRRILEEGHNSKGQTFIELIRVLAEELQDIKTRELSPSVRAQFIEDKQKIISCSKHPDMSLCYVKCYKSLLKNLDNLRIAFDCSMDGSLNSVSEKIEQNGTLTETQLMIFNKVVEELNESSIFAGKLELKKSFEELMIWFIKKISYCLEEESFLRDKAIKYIEENKERKYIPMEDDFFLPFLLEKLSDTFGNQRVTKKPQKFNGEIDILFDNVLPIELKVWRKEHKNLENTIDEKFPHIRQAAAYASTVRVGFLVILDISLSKNELKNIENYCRVLTKEFTINKHLPTKIIALIFDCNHITSSSL